MRYISHRIEKLELRKTSSSNKDYLEVVKWVEDKNDKDYCFTVALFEGYSEGYKLVSVGDRIVLNNREWMDFGILIRLGFKFLQEDVNYTDQDCEGGEE